jgi:hypothetical protein
MFPGKIEAQYCIYFARTRVERLCTVKIQIKLKFNIELLDQIILEISVPIIELPANRGHVNV